MKIESYIDFIRLLPVREHSMIIKYKNWEKFEEVLKEKDVFLEEYFSRGDCIEISRQDIFEERNINQKIFKIILWWYSSWMRGDNFKNILENFEKISEVFSKPTFTSYEEFKNLLKERSVKGMWLSTYTKLLYFFEIKFDNIPCVILDQKIIDVLNWDKWQELQNLKDIRYDSRDANSCYLDYLSIVNNISQEYSIDPEKLELFLFNFGNNLKS